MAPRRSCNQTRCNPQLWAVDAVAPEVLLGPARWWHRCALPRKTAEDPALRRVCNLHMSFGSYPAVAMGAQCMNLPNSHLPIQILLPFPPAIDSSVPNRSAFRRGPACDAVIDSCRHLGEAMGPIEAVCGLWDGPPLKACKCTISTWLPCSNLSCSCGARPLVACCSASSFSFFSFRGIHVKRTSPASS